MMNAVGGTTLHYWAQSWRLNPWDFKVVSETTRRYGASRIPKGSTVEDWPFGLDELEPYYDKVEYEIGVSGKAGNINGRIDPRGNIFEGPRAREYPMPPLRGTGFTEMMADAARKLGWHPFPGPAAINSRSYQKSRRLRVPRLLQPRRLPHQREGLDGGDDDPEGAGRPGVSRSSPRRTSRRSRSTPDGRVSGVNYLKDGTEYFQPADVVLLASYVYENVRLLLLSKSKAYPNGLSNNHGQVGRHYFSHNQSGGVTALFPRDLNNWYGLPAQGVAVDDWADDNFDHSGLDFIGGGNLWVYSDRRPIARGQHEHVRPGAAMGLGVEGVHQAERRPLEHRVPPEDDAAVRGQLSRSRSDGEGSARVSRVPDHRRLQGQRAESRGVHPGQDGASGSWRPARWRPRTAGIGTMGPTTHAYGGTRMGDNPETNVVDRWGFSHEAPNLGILGASVMGTSGARNPTLTAQALAWRTADHLAKNWKTIAT